MFFDRTGLLLGQAQKVGDRLATLRLKNLLRYVLGIATTPFKWKGTSYAVYQTSTPWINKTTTGNALENWTDINEAWLLGTDNLDPNTGEPVNFMPDTLLVPPALAMTAKYINNATETRKGDGASQTAITVGSNPIAGMIPNIVVSSQMKQLLDIEGGLTAAQAAASWFLGSPRKAFAYMENWGLTPATLPASSEMEFKRDIVAAYKISERGPPAVLDPRHMIFLAGA